MASSYEKRQLRAQRPYGMTRSMRGLAVARISTTWVSLGSDRIGYMCFFRLGYHLDRIGSDVDGFEDISIDVTTRVYCFMMVRGSREYDPNGVPANHGMHNYVGAPHV